MASTIDTSGIDATKPEQGSATTASVRDNFTAIVAQLGNAKTDIESLQTDKQPLDATLTALAGVTTAANKLIYATGSDAFATADITAAGLALLDDADAAAQRTTLGLGTIATQSADAVDIGGGAIAGIQDLAIADGGTGASTAAGARDNLDLFSKTELTKAIGNINNPLTWLPLMGPDDAIKLQGDFQYLCESNTTHIDSYGVLQKNAYYSGTPTSADAFSVTDTGATFGSLSGYVIYLTDGSNTAYRWIDSATSTKALWRKPIAFTPTSYKLSKPRFEKEGLLVEGASTNLLLWSEVFDTTASGSAWANSRVTVTSDATTAPDGTSTADKVVEDTTASASHNLNQNYAGFVAGTTYTFSMFIKAGERTEAYLSLGSGAFGSETSGQFDLSTGTYTAINASSGDIESLGNGWYRCWITATATLTAVTYARMYLLSGGTASYTGDGTSGLYVWGGDLKALPYASSYIHTTSAAATTAPPNTQKMTQDNAPNKDITVLVDVEPLANGASLNNANIRFFGGTDSRGSQYEVRTYGADIGNNYSAGVLTGTVTFTIPRDGIVAGESARWGFRLEQDGSSVNWAVFKNGVSVGSGTVTATLDHSNSGFSFGIWSNTTNVFPAKFRNGRVFDRALTDAEMKVA